MEAKAAGLCKRGRNVNANDSNFPKRNETERNGAEGWPAKYLIVKLGVLYIDTGNWECTRINHQ